MKKTGIKRLQLLTIVLVCFSVQQTVYAQSSWKFKKAELNYVDLSGSDKVTAQPVKSEIIKLKKAKSSDTATIIINSSSIFL